MKSKNITTIIAEGTDGVGKSALIDELFKIYNYRYMVYHRGELSNLFYAMKYNRPFSVTQNGLPFLHVLLTCDKEELKERIKKRSRTLEEQNKELAKINDQDEFIRLAYSMMNDYHIIIVDTTNLTIEDVGKKVAKKIDEYVASLDEDKTISDWNRMYADSCTKLNLNFSVRANQPYINNVPFMSELTNQQGVYERFDNKDYPDNLIYSMNYDISEEDLLDKRVDFAYVINSKINRRLEIFDYYDAFDKADKTFMTSVYIDLQSENQIRVGRIFGNQFIKTLSMAKATVYCARDLAHLKMQTARLYEAILARQVVFVDEESDLDNDILRSIWSQDRPSLEKVLRVNPQTIVERYSYVFSDEELVEYILDKQLEWYNTLKKTVGGGKF